MDRDIQIKVWFFVVGIVIVLGGFFQCNASFNDETVTITVQEKERIVNNNESKYLIFTENEVFENTDNWLRVKFNSSDFYSKLKIGQAYKVVVVGYRIPFLSMYRNIIRVVE